MKSEDWKTFNPSTLCYICNQEFSETLFKVKDHCHICGKVRGTAHPKCNIVFQLRQDITMEFETGSVGLPHNARQLFSDGLQQTLQRPLEQQEHWLIRVQAARG